MTNLSAFDEQAAPDKTGDRTGSTIAPTLIGGSGRTGKTQLAIALMEGGGPIAGFPLEGVFHVYHKRRFPFFSAQRQRIVREYIARPRYVDATRSRVERPSQYLDSDIEQLVRMLPEHVDHQIKLIGWTLDQFASAHGRKTWAAFDLHPEFRFEAYRRLIPDLQLVVMQRDPNAMIAANLFWRTHPDPPTDRRKRFLHALFLACLSANATRRLEDRHPDCVTRFSFDALVAADQDEIIRIADHFAIEPEAIREAFDFDAHFSFDPDRGFLGPDGTWAPLLTPAELRAIARAQKGSLPHFVLGPLAVLGGRMPNSARAIADFYLYPAQSIRRQINTVRQILVDLRAGIQARAAKQDTTAPFFVVSGCHGVGKTTTVELVSAALTAQGHTIEGFHHRVKGSKILAGKGKSGAPVPAARWRRILRWMAPKSLRGIRTAVKDARHYERVLGTEIEAVQASGAIVLLDRYIYDQLVDVRLWSRPWYQIWPIGWSCRRMPQPALTFILHDEPEHIHARKPEMSVMQIEAYQDMIARLLARLRAPYRMIDLRRRDSEQVSREITDMIEAHLQTRAHATTGNAGVGNN